jgi:hypothetical protein
VRGQIVAAHTKGNFEDVQLRRKVAADERYVAALDGLISDGLVTVTDGLIHLTK